MAKREEARRLKERAQRLEAEARNWEQGAEGEAATAALLQALERSGWGVLHDRAIPGSRANIDHILLGPPGVVVVDSKNYGGRVNLGSGTLWHNRLPMTRQVESLQWYVDTVRKELSDGSVGFLPVRGVLCVHGATVEVAHPIGGIVVLRAEALVGWLESLPAALPATRIPELMGRAATLFPPKTAEEGLSASRPVGSSRPSGPPTATSRSRADVRPRSRSVPPRRHTRVRGRALGSLFASLASLVVLVAAGHSFQPVKQGPAEAASDVGSAGTAPLSANPLGAPAPKDVTGQFACYAISHTYDLETDSSPGILRYVDSQNPGGSEIGVPFGTAHFTGVDPSEKVVVEVAPPGGSWGSPVTLTAPSAPC